MRLTGELFKHNRGGIKMVYRQTKIKGWFELQRTVCPVCGKSGGCMIHESGNKIACIRERSEIQFGKGSCQSWLHQIKDGVKVDVGNTVSTTNSRKKFPVHLLHGFFSKLAKEATTELTQMHSQHLATERKLTKSTIIERQYRSFPKHPSVTAKNVLGHFADRLADPKMTVGIPGFYMNQDSWTINGQSGILIPYRNEYNFITGYQIRVDEVKNFVETDQLNYPNLKAYVLRQPNYVNIVVNGKKFWEGVLEHGKMEKVVDENGEILGTVKLARGQRYYWLSSPNKKYGTVAGDPIPIHVAIPSRQLESWNKAVEADLSNSDSDSHTTLRKSKAVWITEGALKADIAIDHIAEAFSDVIEEVGDTMLAAPGVNSWRGLLPMLKTMGVKRVNIAFDMDAIENEHVSPYFHDMVKEFKSLGYEVYVAAWSLKNGKGIDDLFLNSFTPQLRKL